MLEGKFVRHAKGKHYPVPEKEFFDEETHLLLETKTDSFKYFSYSSIFMIV